ncbi:MAG: phosphatidylglycerol lysyltransferase domain-containing protein [Propionibacteriaceae bacterium]|nr:phosphatidylglycerol lysyltransferase domain-containing protein [Propionibacteriaceae bacterium]
MLVRRLKRALQNIAILLLLVASLASVVEPFLQRLRPIQRISAGPYPTIINPYGINVDIHRVLAFTLGLLSAFLAFKLYQRMRLAWIIEIMLQSALLMLNVLHPRLLLLPVIVTEAFVLLVLGLTHRDFSRSPDRPSVFRALAMAAAVLVVVLINAVASVFVFKAQFAGVHTFYDAVGRTLRFLAMMDAGYSGYTSRVGLVFANSLIVIAWLCISGAVLLILKPLIYDPLSGMYDRRKAYAMVRSMGQNPVSYLALENDKRYFFSEAGSGFVAYTVIGGVLVCCGDVICTKEDSAGFVREIVEFARKNGWGILFVDVTDAMLEAYGQCGFGVAKLGEDACFNLAEYNLHGNKVAKVRAAINRANKDGMTVAEYRPTEQRDFDIERDIEETSRQWFKGKGQELGFMLGGIGLDNPMERRYFYARDAAGVMVGFVVFLPYGTSAYMADITRRVPDGPQGVLEKIIYEAFMQMRDEGVQWGNLGLCPLVNVRSEDEKTPVSWVFQFVYENLSGVFDFKALHHAKKKFAPTTWQPRYVAYSPKPFSPRYVYAMIRVQSPTGIRSLFSRGAHKDQPQGQTSLA